MQAGKLRHRGTIQQATETLDAQGNATPTWSTFADRWMDIQPLTGRELWSARQVQSQVSHKIVLRHLSGVTTKMRVSVRSRTFNIESIINANERDRMLELMCTEVV